MSGGRVVIWVWVGAVVLGTTAHADMMRVDSTNIGLVQPCDLCSADLNSMAELACFPSSPSIVNVAFGEIDFAPVLFEHLERTSNTDSDY